MTHQRVIVNIVDDIPQPGNILTYKEFRPSTNISYISGWYSDNLVEGFIVLASKFTGTIIASNCNFKLHLFRDTAEFVGVSSDINLSSIQGTLTDNKCIKCGTFDKYTLGLACGTETVDYGNFKCIKTIKSHSVIERQIVGTLDLQLPDGEYIYGIDKLRIYKSNVTIVRKYEDGRIYTITNNFIHMGNKKYPYKKINNIEIVSIDNIAHKLTNCGGLELI